jgi:hypothetical protein
MAKPLIDTVLLNARTIVADRRRRLRGAEAVAPASPHEVALGRRAAPTSRDLWQGLLPTRQAAPIDQTEPGSSGFRPGLTATCSSERL